MFNDQSIDSRIGIAYIAIKKERKKERKKDGNIQICEYLTVRKTHR